MLPNAITDDFFPFGEHIPTVKLDCFFTKTGEKTYSPYEAQLWKNKYKKVFIRFRDYNDKRVERPVSRFHFYLNYDCYVSINTGKSNKKVRLENVKCDMRVIDFDRMFFASIPASEMVSIKNAEKNIFSTLKDVNCEEKIREELKKGRNVTLFYEDFCFGNLMKAVTPYVDSVDIDSMIVTTKKQKIFLAEK